MGIHTLGQTASPERDSEAPRSRPRLHLLFECDRPAASSMSIGLDGISELQLGRGAVRKLHEQPHWHLQIPDGWLSSKHARMQDSFGRWILHDEGSKNGCKVNGEDVQRHELQDGDLIELGRTFFLFRVAPDDGLAKVIDLDGVPADQGPLTLNPDLAQEVAKLEKLAQTDISILILGESGTGKEVLAQRIHLASQRRSEFVPVNCGALPAGLVESELFGHKKGAFSGAVADHIGLVRKADAGTLFLDEIADLPASAQATLLRVLQEKEVRAVGDTASHAIDLRTVSATHLNLDARVEKGDFRRDLFARIANYRLTLPPLHRRREDMGLLICAFLKDLGHEGHRFSVEAGRALLSYPWPLNIRELRSCLATATVLADEGRIELAHLPEAVRSAPSQTQTPLPAAESEATDLERQLLAQLAEHHGNVSAVARSMDKDRKQIQRWIKRFQIDLNRFRNS